MPGGATSGTATVISSLPFTDSDTTPTSAGLWYVYTPTIGIPPVIGGLVTSTVSGMEIVVYSPDGVTPFALLAPFVPRNKPFQMPVSATTPYYFNVLGSNPGAYTFSLLDAPNLTAPIGSIFVNDDHAGYPLALLSVVDASVLHFVSPFPNGENGDVLASGDHLGRILVHDRNDDHLKLYSPAFDLLADLAYTSTGDPKYPIRADHTRSQFYVGLPVDPNHGNFATVTTVTSAGAFGPQTWVLPAAGLTGIATNVAGTILYFTGQTTSTNSPIQRWDLVNDVALTNLAPGNGATWLTLFDIIVLGDDTVVVSYESTTTSTAPVVKHYDTDGTVLGTWTMTGGRSTDVHLATALDDPISVWVWTKNAGISTFWNIQTSDGSTLTSFTAREFELGVWLGTGTPPADPDRFGHSFSCPFLILRGASPPVGTVTGTIAATFPPVSGSPSGEDAPLEAALTGYRLPPRHLESLCRTLMTIAALMPDARQRMFNSLGTVLAGSKLQSYEAGTTTPLPTYSDSGLTVPNSNPQIADSGGLLGPIYLLAQAYKFVLYDANNLQIWSQDNVWDSGELLGATVAALQTEVTANLALSTTKFCSTQFSQSTSAAFANIIGLTGFSLTAGHVYKFDIALSGTSGASGGMKIGFGLTTATLTSLESSAQGCTASAIAVQHTTTATSGMTLFGQTAAVIAVRLTGQITVNVGGTLAVQAAQNASDGAATVIYTGSWATFTKVS